MVFIIFVTVQLFEDILAQLFLNKWYEEHDYTYECYSDSESRLTKTGNHIFFRFENIIPLEDPGLSSRCLISSSTSPLYDQSISLESVNTRRNDEARKYCSRGVTGNCNVKVFPDDFTENFEIAEALASADISRDSHPERLLKVTSRKHWHFTHFPKES